MSKFSTELMSLIIIGQTYDDNIIFGLVVVRDISDILKGNRNPFDLIVYVHIWQLHSNIICNNSPD